MRKIVIISIIICLVFPIFLYFALNYYRDNKFSYISTDVDNLNQLKDIVGRGISKRNKAILRQK